MLILQLMANSQNAFRAFVLMSRALMVDAALPAEDREALILDIAQRHDIPYEWFEHTTLSERAGVSETQRDAIAADNVLGNPLFSSRQQLAVRMGRTITCGHPLSDDDWKEATAAWGAGALDAVLSIAWWGGFVALVLRALDMRHAKEGQA